MQQGGKEGFLKQRQTCGSLAGKVPFPLFHHACRLCIGVEHLPVVIQGQDSLRQLIQYGREQPGLPACIVPCCGDGQGRGIGLAYGFFAGVKQYGRDGIFPAYFYHPCITDDDFRVVFQGIEDGLHTVPWRGAVDEAHVNVKKGGDLLNAFKHAGIGNEGNAMACLPGFANGINDIKGRYLHADDGDGVGIVDLFLAQKFRNSAPADDDLNG